MLMNNNKSQSKNFIHYSNDLEKFNIALEKARKTRNKNKYKNNKIRQECKRKIDEDIKIKIKQSSLYNKEKTIQILSKNDTYQKYIGKSKNLTMIKDDISLYKSVLEYTKEFEPYCSGKMPLSCRVQLIGQFYLNLPKHYYCRCGLKINYEKSKQIFTYRGFCRKCLINPNSKDWFKYKYEDKWEIEYNKYQNREDFQKIKKLRGRLAVESKLKRGVNEFINKGLNEEKILDFFEKTLQIKIDRNFHVLGYHPDGYCHETNTIYEVYEKHHLYTEKMEYDTKRQKEITDKLQCNFVIIYDDKMQEDISKLKIENYENK
jgi:hypothetical protein